MVNLLQRPFTVFTVEINGYTYPELQVLKVDDSLGGHTLNVATIAYDLGPYKGPFVHVANVSLTEMKILPIRDVNGDIIGTQPMMGGVCKIFKSNPGQPDPPTLIHTGFVNVDEVTINQEEERLEFMSRLDKAAFGIPLTHQRVLWIEPLGDAHEATYIGDQCVFNPPVDGVIFGNMRPTPDPPNADPTFNRPMFVHPESVRTAESANFQDAEHANFDPADINSGPWRDEKSPANWTLADVVEYLCAECNPSQTLITNPSRSDLDDVLDASLTLVKNLTVQPGLYIHEALDVVLEPYGYSWYIDFTSGNPTITVIEKGGEAGVAIPFVPLLFPAVGSTLDVAAANSPDLALEANIGTVVNQVRIFGSYFQLEGTWELFPSWSTDDDNSDPLLWMKNDPFGQWKASNRYHRVHRAWTLNEAGDYNNQRPNITQPFDFTPLFRQMYGNSFPRIAQRRRRFLPTLTVQQPAGSSPSEYNAGVNIPAGTHGGCQIQFWDNYESEWVDLRSGQADWEVQILQNECGIEFTGEMPPMELVSLVQDGVGRLRICGTITSDTLVMGFAPRETTSLIPRVIEQTLNMPDDFHARLVVRSGSNASIYAASATFSAMEANGVAACQQLADLLRDAWDMASISGHAQIEGCDHDQFVLGTKVPIVNGREISMFATAAPSNHAPVIVRRIWTPQQNQRMILYLESVRPTVSTMLSRTTVTPSLHDLRKKHRIKPKAST